MLGFLNKIKYIVIVFFAVNITGCGIYSFTGADYGKAKTVTVHYFVNKAPIINPDLAPMLTEKLQDKFITLSPLTVVESGGDLEFSGTITGYSVAPAQVQAGETAAANKLTITVRVKFVNHTDPTKDFNKTFSWYAYFDPESNLADVETELIDKITDKLADDIFYAAVANW